MFETYDSFAPQKKTLKRLKGWAEVDINKIRADLKAVVEEAEANNPATLKQTIASLKEQLRKAGAQPATSPKEVNDLRAQLEEARLYADRLCRELDQAKQIAMEVMQSSARLQAIHGAGAVSLPKMPALERVFSTAAAPKAAQEARGRVPARRMRSPLDDGPRSLSGSQQRILDKLEWLRSKGIFPARKETLAAMAGMRPTSGAYAQHLADLAKAGYLEYPEPGWVVATPTGRSAAEPPSDGGLAVEEAWLRILSAPQQRILRALLLHHPAAMDKSVLAEAVDARPTSGAYAQHLADLKSLGAIEYPERGRVSLTKYVMPE
jgi:hypothetical protein